MHRTQSLLQSALQPAHGVQLLSQIESHTPHGTQTALQAAPQPAQLVVQLMLQVTPQSGQEVQFPAQTAALWWMLNCGIAALSAAICAVQTGLS